MEKKQKIKNFIIVLIISISIILFFNYVVKVEIEVIGIIGTILVVMMPSVLSFITSNKTNEIIKHLANEVNDIKLDNMSMKKGIHEIEESFKHKREIVNLCQEIEIETSEIFDNMAEINTMLKDYIVGVNDTITDIIRKQYEYDFEKFDAKYFKTKLINKITQLNDTINFIMLDKSIFEKISDKVLLNVRNYITDLKYIKDLENGKRRNEFKELTLRLTKQITNHSLFIYNNYNQIA